MNLTGIRSLSLAVVIGLALFLVSLAVLGALPAAVQAAGVSDTGMVVDGAVDQPGPPPPEQISSQCLPPLCFTTPYVLEIYAGASTSDAGDLVWSLEADDVYEVDPDGADSLIFTISGDDLVAPDGRVLCTSEPGTSEGIFVFSNSDGPLFTVKGRHPWYGAVDVPDEGSSGWETALSQRAYDVWHNQLYPGPKGKTDALISAMADIQNVMPVWKLVIMALVEGECGSSGLPRPTPQ
jgi:hypothetical protein